MAIWGLDKLPLWKNWQKAKNGIVATARGWEDARTHEILVSVSNLAERAGAADVAAVAFDTLVYAQGDAIKVVVTFNERVFAATPCTLVISSTGLLGDVTATAPASVDPAGSNVLEFAAVVPAEACELSVASQTIVGTVNDATGTMPASNLTISAPIAAAAGTRVVA